MAKDATRQNFHIAWGHFGTARAIDTSGAEMIKLTGLVFLVHGLVTAELLGLPRFIEAAEIWDIADGVAHLVPHFQYKENNILIWNCKNYF